MTQKEYNKKTGRTKETGMTKIKRCLKKIINKDDSKKKNIINEDENA